jgi:(R,R)-butanediol dehydrogenase/meso-butanediol dehydrogenase/diacetyl reductase
MKRMNALIYEGKHTIVCQEVDVPEIGDEEALIQVIYAGICGSDLSIVDGKHPRAKPGLIMGHEFSGTLVDIRSQTRKDLHIGDLVVAEPLISCGSCFACLSGVAYVCQSLGLYGIDRPGAFADYVKVPARSVFVIPENISLKLAVLVEPMAVAVHAARLSSLRIGDSVCVLGGGPIGLLTALVAQQAGARTVLMSEIQPFRMSLAREFGIDVLNPTQIDLQQAVFNRTKGRGVDIVFEAAGSEQTVLIAPKLCRVQGEVIMIAMPKVLRSFDIVAYTFKEITMKGVRVYAPFDFERAIHLIAECPHDLTKLLSGFYLLSQGTQAFEEAKNAKESMRVVFNIKEQKRVAHHEETLS